jgi:hypothetical protein
VYGPILPMSYVLARFVVEEISTVSDLADMALQQTPIDFRSENTVTAVR